jgi:hypothetical protein
MASAFGDALNGISQGLGGPDFKKCKLNDKK